MERELTNEEQEFIKTKLDKRNITYDSDKKEYVKKNKDKKNKVTSALWMVFRPRNWSILVIIVAAVLLNFLINTIQTIKTFLGSGILEFINDSGMTLGDFSTQAGIDVSSIQDLVYFYDNKAIFIAVIVSVAIVLVAILLILDIIIKNHRNKKMEVH